MAVFGSLFTGCNYVLHSSGQLFSHKRKHERRFWECGTPSKQRKLVVSSATSAEATASGSDDVLIVPNPSITTASSQHGVQPTVTQSTATIREPVDSTMLCATTTAQPGEAVSTQPSESKLTAVSQANVSQPIQSSSVSVPDGDPVASPSTAAVARCSDEMDESTKRETVQASTAVDTASTVETTSKVDSAQPDMDSQSDDLVATRQSPVIITVNDDDAPATGSSSALPVNVVEQSFTLRPSTKMPARLDDVRLKKLEKKEYVDLEDLAKMTKFKQIVDEKKTGSESPQSTNIVNFSGVCDTSLTLNVSPANSSSTTASASALSMMPSKALTITKCPRTGIEKKERDESWQNYIKRSEILLSEC